MFGGSNISEELYRFILDNVPRGSLLEFGSGAGSTQNLSKHYKMYSIEHNAQYVGAFNSTYIHAPIKNGWYDVDVLKSNLPEEYEYDAVLIDGPVGEGNRSPVLNHLDLFGNFKDKWVICDDTHRYGELHLFTLLLTMLEHSTVYLGKEFGAMKVL